jgi:hypothetical protein
VRKARILQLLALGAVAVLSIAGPASAAPITFTQSEKFTESFTGDIPCHPEQYAQTVTGHTVTHLTARTDADGNIVPPLRFTDLFIGTAVIVPVDGTGPSYVGHFHTFDLETIRSVRHGDVIAEVDTDLDHGVLIGSDGSTVVFREVAHFTVNANGDVSVAFDKFTLSC